MRLISIVETLEPEIDAIIEIGMGTTETHKTKEGLRRAHELLTANVAHRLAPYLPEAISRKELLLLEYLIEMTYHAMWLGRTRAAAMLK